MYVATKDTEDKGSTALHMDAADAVNVLIHAIPTTSEPQIAGALWHIFHPADSPMIRAYLTDWYEQSTREASVGVEAQDGHDNLETIPLDSEQDNRRSAGTTASAFQGDLIHTQQTYLTEPMLGELASPPYNVKPFRIIQEVGDAIFIPAGAAHQVIYNVI